MNYKKSPLLNTFQLLNKKWTIEIIMELFKDRKRFSDLLEIDSALTSKVLSERLKELYENNIIEKIVYNMIPFKFKYQLTNQGINLKRIFYECALFSCLYYPNDVFVSQPQNTKEVIADLKKLFQLENDS